MKRDDNLITPAEIMEEILRLHGHAVLARMIVSGPLPGVTVADFRTEEQRAAFVAIEKGRRISQELMSELPREVSQESAEYSIAKLRDARKTKAETAPTLL